MGALFTLPVFTNRTDGSQDDPELSMGWVGLGQDFSVFGGLDWVVFTVAKVLKNLQ